jgi:hypothetical protein
MQKRTGDTYAPISKNDLTPAARMTAARTVAQCRHHNPVYHFSLFFHTQFQLNRFVMASA